MDHKGQMQLRYTCHGAKSLDEDPPGERVIEFFFLPFLHLNTRACTEGTCWLVRARRMEWT